jgi:hypothetical protein
MPTQEDIDKLKAILAGNAPQPVKAPVPVPPELDTTTSDVPASDDQSVAARLKAIVTPGVKQPPVAIPQIDPQSVRAPYDQQAKELSDRADATEQAAMQPRPQPNALVTGLRAALESFGKFGAPGGYAGQEQQRQQDYEKQQGLQVNSADKMRALAEKMQGLGVNEENVARQENYNQGQLDETRQLRARQEEATKEAERHNVAMEEQGKFVSGGNGLVFDARNGHIVQQATPKDQNLRHIQVQMNGKPEIWSIDSKSQLVAKVADATPGSGGSSSDTVIQPGTDENGNPVLYAVSKSQHQATPVTQKGNGAPLQTADAGKANVKNDAKNAEDFETSQNSLAAMEGLMKRGTYASDQALGDQFFNIVKPGSGARMNQQQIERFMTPGPLKDKMIAWAQKLDQGQPLTPEARQDLYESAKVVVQSKQPKPRGAALAPAAAPSSAGWSVKVVK